MPKIEPASTPTGGPGSGGAPVALLNHRQLHIRQRYELGEFLGFETRNKYEVLDQQQMPLAYAAEQGKGFWKVIARHLLRNMRSFDIQFFTAARVAWMVAKLPFRWFFRRLELFDMQGAPLGVIQGRFSFLRKRFDLIDASGQVRMIVSSPLWKPWTFAFEWNQPSGLGEGVRLRDRPAAHVRKKWAGLLAEGFTAKDNFVVEFDDEASTEADRRLVLAAAVFIDIQYFERKN